MEVSCGIGFDYFRDFIQDGGQTFVFEVDIPQFRDVKIYEDVAVKIYYLFEMWQYVRDKEPVHYADGPRFCDAMYSLSEFFGVFGHVDEIEALMIFFCGADEIVFVFVRESFIVEDMDYDVAGGIFEY